MKKILSVFIFQILACTLVLGQGSTTGAISGEISDESGLSIPGATILVTHQPSGSKYGGTSNIDGRYRIANMQVGGPYQVEVTFVGYQPNALSNVYLTLGQTLKLDFTIKEKVTELNAVEVVSSADNLFDGNRTGAQTVVTEQGINAIPNVGRSFADFTRTTPMASLTESTDGFSVSLGGINNRYNAIYIDGAVNNDVFGLAGSGTNGGQTGVSPISIDAIEQFQIALAPFDVRQSGFAGGSISAITRSGSNQVEGSAYYLFRNQDLSGKTPTDDEAIERKQLNDFSSSTYGFRLGGPIVKNKLFFFINGEIQRDETPQPFNASIYEGDSDEAGINTLINKLRDDYGYDPGAYNNNTAWLYSDKLLVKFDYNLNQNHKISLRHSYTKADNLEALRSDPRNIRFVGASEYFISNTHSTALEIKSILKNNMGNNFIFGATTVRDDRDPYGSPFPYISINDGRGRISIGSEQFSTANQLKQDVFTITDNFEIFRGKHSITIGTHNEMYKAYNLFIRQNYGVYNYDSLSQFLLNQNATSYSRNYSLVDDVTGDGSKAGTAFNGFQFGIYVQDEFQANDKLKITGGLRLDVPVFPDATPENANFNNQTIPLIESAGYDLMGARTGQFIKSQFLFAPRFGFNYDLRDNRATQIRGGLGIFNSRIPLVWPGGAYNNNGATVGGDFLDAENGDAIVFNPAWNGQPREIAPNSGFNSGQIDLFARNFKFPQVFKASLAVDQRLPWGMVGTLEVLYNDFINNVRYQNLNIRPASASTTGSDVRPRYDYRDLVDDTYTGIFLASNTNKGYSYNFTAQVQKPFEKGFTGLLSYTYGDAYSLYDGTSSQNNSQWEYLVNARGRNIQEAAERSNFSMGSRVVGQLSYRKEYLGFAATQISLLYNGQSGAPFSYVYDDNSDLTNETSSRETTLIYIPKNQNDIVLLDQEDRSAAQQWQELNAFIESDKSLNENRGSYAKRNGSRAPFSSIFDLRVVQDFYLEVREGKRNTLQLSLDIFNLGNFINKDWGRIYNVSSEYQLLTFEGFQADGTTPTYTFNGVKNNEPWTNNIEDNGLRRSRWMAQVGLRYIFGK